MSGEPIDLADATIERLQRQLTDVRAVLHKPEHMWDCPCCHAVRVALGDDDDPFERIPMYRTEAGFPNCATCDGGGCHDCTEVG